MHPGTKVNGAPQIELKIVKKPGVSEIYFNRDSIPLDSQIIVLEPTL